jgi:hypothetical protein
MYTLHFIFHRIIGRQVQVSEDGVGALRKSISADRRQALHALVILEQQWQKISAYQELVSLSYLVFPLESALAVFRGTKLLAYKLLHDLLGYFLIE